jgi:hypothetical protein
MKSTIAVLRLSGIQGLCLETRYRGYIELDSFSLIPPDANTADRSFGFSFFTAYNESIPQLCRKWSERIVLEAAELVVLRKGDRHELVEFQAKMGAISLTHVRVLYDAGSAPAVPKAAVDARIGSLDLGIGVEMCDGWNAVGGLASVRFQWKVAGTEA